MYRNFQSLWATWEDTYMTELNKPFLGKERMELQYPMVHFYVMGLRLHLEVIGM